MLTQLYEMFMGYALGGTVAVVLFALLYRKSSSVANSGNKAKMATFSIAPALLVIVSILAATAAFNFAIPRLQSAVTSAPVLGAVQAGGVAVQAIDGLLAAPAASGGTVEFQPMSFNVPGQPVLPNTGTWLGGSLNNVAPGSVAAPTVEPTAPGSMFTFPTATPYVRPGQQVASGSYTVASGDSMYKIAARLLGDGNRYVELCRINRAIVGNSCQLRPGMKLSLDGAGITNRPIVEQPDYNYQPLVLQSAADRQPVQAQPQQDVIQRQVQQVIQAQPTATAMPLIFEAARNTPTPTPVTSAVTIPYANEKANMPLVLMAAQD